MMATETADTMRVTIRNERTGAFFNRMDATLEITGSEYRIQTADGEETFARDEHKLVNPGL